MTAITKQQALKLIGNKKYYHTFRSGKVLLGYEYTHHEIMEMLDKYSNTLELAGSKAAAIEHGLVLHDDISYLFIETIPEELESLEKELL